MDSETVRPRLLALFSEPLIDSEGRPLPRLALDQERNDLKQWLEDCDLDIDFQPGSLDDFQRALLPSVGMLHFSGHGNEDGLLLENQSGVASFLRREDLAGILAASNDG